MIRSTVFWFLVSALC